MRLQKLQCNKCQKLKYERSGRGIAKAYYTCKECKRKHEDKSEPIKESSNEV